MIFYCILASFKDFCIYQLVVDTKLMECILYVKNIFWYIYFHVIFECNAVTDMTLLTTKMTTMYSGIPLQDILVNWTEFKKIGMFTCFKIALNH